MDDPGPLAPLSSITAPTSIVHGDQEPVYPLAHGETLARRDSRFHLARNDLAERLVDTADSGGRG